jgi:hypothetical protein
LIVARHNQTRFVVADIVHDARRSTDIGSIARNNGGAHENGFASEPRMLIRR